MIVSARKQDNQCKKSNAQPAEIDSGAERYVEGCQYKADETDEHQDKQEHVHLLPPVTIIVAVTIIIVSVIATITDINANREGTGATIATGVGRTVITVPRLPAIKAVGAVPSLKTVVGAMHDALKMTIRIAIETEARILTYIVAKLDTGSYLNLPHALTDSSIATKQ
jgi:hypothetical protein